ncbi:protein of unknown function, partial [Pseudomonas inefficax]
MGALCGPFATQGRSYRTHAALEACAVAVGAGLPAKNATRCMAPASPVFAGKPAPTGIA